MTECSFRLHFVPSTYGSQHDIQEQLSSGVNRSLRDRGDAAMPFNGTSQRNYLPQ